MFIIIIIFFFNIKAVQQGISFTEQSYRSDDDENSIAGKKNQKIQKIKKFQFFLFFQKNKKEWLRWSTIDADDSTRDAVQAALASDM